MLFWSPRHHKGMQSGSQRLQMRFSELLRRRSFEFFPYFRECDSFGEFNAHHFLLVLVIGTFPVRGGMFSLTVCAMKPLFFASLASEWSSEPQLQQVMVPLQLFDP